MRRKPGTLVPLEVAICRCAAELRRQGVERVPWLRDGPAPWRRREPEAADRLRHALSRARPARSRWACCAAGGKTRRSPPAKTGQAGACIDHRRRRTGQRRSAATGSGGRWSMAATPGASMTPLPLRLACALVRGWTQFYTCSLPASLRDARRGRDRLRPLGVSAGRRQQARAAGGVAGRRAPAARRARRCGVGPDAGAERPRRDGERRDADRPRRRLALREVLGPQTLPAPPPLPVQLANSAPRRRRHPDRGSGPTRRWSAPRAWSPRNVRQVLLARRPALLDRPRRRTRSGRRTFRAGPRVRSP